MVFDIGISKNASLSPSLVEKTRLKELTRILEEKRDGERDKLREKGIIGVRISCRFDKTGQK